MVAIKDWRRSYVIDWKKYTTLDMANCLEELEMEIEFGKQEIFKREKG